MRKPRVQNPLPTFSVGGGSVPTEQQKTEISKDLADKSKNFVTEHPSKPLDVPSPKKVIKVKNAANSLDSEYIELAKRYLGIDTNGDVSVVTMAKAAISTIDKLNTEIKRLRSVAMNPCGIGGRPLWSGENSSSWN